MRATRHPAYRSFALLSAIAVFLASGLARAAAQAPDKEPGELRVLSLDTWFTRDAMPSYELIHNANTPDRPALAFSFGYPGLRATVSDGWQNKTGVDLIGGQYAAGAIPDKLLKLGAGDRVARFLQRKPDAVALTVQMLGPINKREKREPLLTALKGYNGVCGQHGARAVALAVPEWYFALEDHPRYLTAVSPEIEPMEKLAAETDVPVAPVFLAFEYLRRRHPEVRTNPEFKGYDAAAKGSLYGHRHPGNGDFYVMAAVLYVALTGTRIEKSPDLGLVNAAIQKTRHADAAFVLTAEAQAVIHQVAYEACEDFALRVKAIRGASPSSTPP